MYALFFIAQNNLRKKKGDAAVLLFLVALAALLFYVSISVLSGTEKVLDKAYEDAHTADWLYMTSVDKEELITELVTSQEEVTEFEVTDCLYIVGTKYRSNLMAEADEFAFLLGCMEDERNIGRIPTHDAPSYDAILLPYYLKMNRGYQVGDTFYLTLGEREYAFTVAGFVEDPMISIPMNISVYSCYITRAHMEDILEGEPSLESSRCRQYKARLREGESAYAFDEKISPILSKELPELAQGMNLGLNWESMKNGGSIMSDISMGIVLLFSTMLVLIALIIIRFSIKQFVEMNLKNIGILQASGYTAGQLQAASVLEMTVLAVFGITVGLAAGAFGSGFIGNLEGIMLGLSWNQKYDWRAAGVVAFILFVVVTVTSFFTSAVYGRITVLDALRGGVHTHNFKKNYFPFAESRLPENLALAGKSIFGERAKTISILCIVMLLAFATSLSFALYQNFAVDEKKLLQLSGIEVGDVYVTGENLEQVGSGLEAWEEVEKVLYYNNCITRLTLGEKEITLTCDIHSEPCELQNEMVVEGRLPEYGNEIVLTAGAAEKLGARVGDVIYVEGMGERMDYYVCGIDQKFNNAGIKALVTTEGAERLNGEVQITVLYVYTREGVSVEQMQAKMKEAFYDIDVLESEGLVKDSLEGVSLALRLICVVFVGITVFVVFLVELLLVKAKIIRERKNYGISKALGYTTWQLVGRTMLANVPVILVGAILGVIASIYFASPLTVLFLSGFGIKKCSIETMPVWLLVTVGGIVTLAAIVSFGCSVRIRKIEPVQMLSEE